MGRRNNQPNNSVGDGGGVGEKIRSGGTRRGGRQHVVLGGEYSEKEIKIERAMGPRISMAPAGWDDATTNRKAALSLEYTWERRRAGRWR